TEQLTKVFRQRGRREDVTAVGPTNLVLKRGRSLGVVGESGSGKTTLGRLICGLTRPTSGTVTFDGVDVHRRSRSQPLGGRIQMVFQDPYDALNPRLQIGTSVAEPITLAGREEGRSRGAVADRVVGMLERVQLNASFATRYPAQLSGGQLQRVSIARALASRPQLIVLDEPTSALDWMTRSEIVELLNTLRGELGLTYLFISHDIAAVRAVADDIAVMYHGETLESGPTEQILSDPRNDYTQRLLASVLEPRVGQPRQPQR
ncbi:MAG TPA: ATP-binding cassette domain-containing protein, partial [Jatrophihabitans sp.]|nr:ATP-binding cassette domain-containing protein [Jatrophihabitans sp.]